MTMPHLSGKQLYERALARDPETAAKMVFLTGGVTSPEAAAFLEAVPNVTLMKPLFAGPLRALVADVLATRI